MSGRFDQALEHYRKALGYDSTFIGRKPVSPTPTC